jgi:hypothetical protein
MAIGADRADNHRAALKRLVPGLNPSPDCHIVPMLAEIVYNDMIFALFPLMSSGFSYPFYYQLSEVFDAVEQVLEVRTYDPCLVFFLVLDYRVSNFAMADWSHIECVFHFSVLAGHY